MITPKAEVQSVTHIDVKSFFFMYTKINDATGRSNDALNSIEESKKIMGRTLIIIYYFTLLIDNSQI
jgi:hypothetical protein